jgi:hypothetical protein
MTASDIRIPVTPEEKQALLGVANVTGIKKIVPWARMVLLREARRVAEAQGREEEHDRH